MIIRIFLRPVIDIKWLYGNWRTTDWLKLDGSSSSMDSMARSSGTGSVVWPHFTISTNKVVKFLDISTRIKAKKVNYPLFYCKIDLNVCDFFATYEVYWEIFAHEYPKTLTLCNLPKTFVSLSVWRHFITLYRKLCKRIVKNLHIKVRKFSLGDLQ